MKITSEHWIIILISTIIINSSRSYADWNYSSPLFKPNLYSVSFVDESTGYIGGKNKLYKTTDSGNSWLTIGNISNETIFCLSFLDSNTGIVAGGPYEYQEGFIRITTDGGTTWKSEYNSMNRFISDVKIISHQVAFAIDELGRLYKTNNLNDWAVIHYFPSRCYSIHFVNDQLGWISGNTGKLYKTMDGGNHWETIELGEDLVLFDVYFLNETTGWVISYDGIVFKTSDGGISWNSVNTSYSQLSNVEFVNESVGFISGEGKVLKTTDGGMSWSVTYFGQLGPYWANGITFVNEESGYLVGHSGFIYHTINSGGSWYPQGLNELQNLNKVKIIDDLSAFIVGDNGTILKSTDMGLNWLSLVSPVYTNLNSIQFLNNSNLFVVGDSGTIIKSDNMRDWSKIEIPTLKNLNDLYYFDYMHGIVIGDEGTIYKTSDSGINWQIISSGTSQNLNSVTFKNDVDGFIVGDSGILLRTSDGGMTWNEFNLATDKKLCDIQFPSALVGYINTYEPFLYKTTNGGNDWFAIYSYYQNDNIVTIRFIDESIGWFGTDTKRIYRTSDGGNTWSSRLSIRNILRSIDFYDNNFGIAVGNEGTIMFTLSGGLPVPVELISFNGVQRSGKVYLSWQTITELNNLMFEIQRKIEGSEWITIGYRRGIGSTTHSTDYNFVDDCVGIKAGFTLHYRLKQSDYNGNIEFSDEIMIKGFSSPDYSLSQNYPNPFNPSTTIEYQIPNMEFVTLKIYDVLGNEIAALVSEEKPAGSYSVEFNGSEFPSGVYFYKLQAGNFSQVKKMILLR